MIRAIWACASTRRDKFALHFLSLIQFASIIDWLRYGCWGGKHGLGGSLLKKGDQLAATMAANAGAGLA